MNHIHLRRMSMADADQMLVWKNYSETRQFALISREEIKKEDHYNWLAKNIQYFQVIEMDSMVVGAIRIQDGEISIWLDRAFRGQGIASQVIRLVARHNMTAKIMTANLASMRAFIAAGFRPSSYEGSHYIFIK